jgi:SAM-dependent methyltransferase
MTTTREHFAMIEPLLDLEGRDVLDVGAGDGAFARKLADSGARVTGIEVSEDKVARARAAVPECTFLVGVAEKLPVADASQDAVFLINTFHHVPPGRQADAVAEIVRVLRSGGYLVAVEPRPFGDMSTVMRPVEDESQLRVISQTRLERLAAGPDVRRVHNFEYVHERVCRDVEELIERSIAVDPARAARLPAARTEIERRFSRYARSGNGGFVLSQPSVLYVYLKA